MNTEFPFTDYEMYIRQQIKGTFEGNRSLPLNRNDSYRFSSADFFSNSDMMKPELHQMARGVSLVVFLIFGFVCNTFMIIAIVPNRRLRTVRNILLVHLGCTNILFSFFINLSTAVVSLTGKWFEGIFVCQVYGFLLTVLTFVTTWTITALSWDKYQTIASPLHHSFTATAVKMTVCFTVFWTVACTLSLPPLLGGNRHIYHAEKGICFVCTKSLTGKIYTFSFLLAAVFIPLGIMLFCYTHIYRIARTQSSRIAATMVQMTSVIHATIAPNSQPASLSIKGTKAICTIFQLIGSFIIVYLPLSVILLTEIFTADDFKVNSVISSTLIMLFLSAPVVHSSIYGLRNKILRTSFETYIRRKIRYHCYKDKRKNSIKSFKSFRSSSFKVNFTNKRQQNGNAFGLRRTQSFPVRGSRGLVRNVRVSYSKQKGILTIPEEPIVRPHSSDALSQKTSPDIKSEELREAVNIHFDISDIPDIEEEDV